MKRILLAAALALFAMTAGAQALKTYTGDALKIGFSAQPPIVAGDKIEYEVWLRVGAAGTAVLLATLATAPTDAAPYVVTLMAFANRTLYQVGVRTKRTPPGTTTANLSEFTWSNLTGDAVRVPTPFDLQRPDLEATPPVQGLHVVP